MSSPLASAGWAKTTLGGIFSILSLLALAGCGNTFRPVAIPITQNGGDPGGLRNAIIVSQNPAGAGSTLHIDVSGDTVASAHTVGIGPVQAVLAGGRTWVANKSDGTLTGYTTFGGPGVSSNTATLPAGACPVAMTSTETSALYVADPGAGCAGGGTGNVDVINLIAADFTGQVPVGVNPVSIAELPNGSKIYVANQGDNSVTVINAVDHSIAATITTGIGNSPSFVVPSADSACVYVANQGDGTVSVIATGNDAVAAGSPVTVGAGPSFLAFDAHAQRVYVANTAGNSVSVLSHVNTCTPTLIGTVAVGSAPTSIAPLADGTRVYVANSGSNNVSVINASSVPNGTPKSIPVGSAPLSVAASDDNSRVYVANSGSGNVSIINTGNDTEINRVATSSPTPVYVLVTP